MKVKQILEIMKTVHNSKLPYDMELLDKQFYTSESQNKTYSINDMDIMHLVRSFIKMQRTLNEEERRDTQEGKIAYVQKILDKYVAENRELRDKVYKCEKEIDQFKETEERETTVPYYTSNTIHKLEKKISELLEKNEQYKKHCNNSVNIDVYEMLFDKCERLERRIKSFYESQIPSSVPTATFNYIPNNEEGQKLVDDMKQYLNKERYTLKDRGQCINREKYSLDEVSTDRGIDKKEYGKYLKVHINEKRRK